MLKLLSDFVAIRPDPPVERRHGKIIIPQTVDTSADSGWIEEGTIVAAGPGDRDTPDGSLRPVTVKAGDRVLYVGGRSGTWVDVDGESLLVVHEEQFILAVIEAAVTYVCGGCREPSREPAPDEFWIVCPKCGIAGVLPAATMEFAA